MKSRKKNAVTKTASSVSSQPGAATAASVVSPTRVDEPDDGQKSVAATLPKTVPSPTSVVLHPLPNALKNDRRRPPTYKAKRHSDRRVVPRVVMGEEGAEITLDTLAKQERPPLADRTNLAPPAVTPDMPGRRRLPHMNSLLDADISPSTDIPSSPDTENKEQQRPSFSAQIFCGTGAPGCLLSDDSDACALANAPQPSVERTIALLLGDPAGLSGWCHAWQAWFLFGLGHGANHDESTRETKEDMKRVLRNRAYDLNSRNRRITMLKDDLNPFDESPTRLGTPIPLTKTRSFSGYESFQHKTNNLRSSSSNDVSISVASLGSAVWESIPGCGQPDSDSPAVVRSRDFGDDLCYDSDPEEITRRRPQHGASNEATFLAFDDTKIGLDAVDHKSDLVIPRRLESIFNDDSHAKDLVQVS